MKAIQPSSVANWDRRLRFEADLKAISADVVSVDVSSLSLDAPQEGYLGRTVSTSAHEPHLDVWSLVDGHGHGEQVQQQDEQTLHEESLGK